VAALLRVSGLKPLKRHCLVPGLLLEREPAQKEKTVTDRPENGNEVMEKKQETEESS
jgi:hypothetical protein